jgi:phage-related protein
MLSISSVSKAEKNKLHIDSVFLILLDIIPAVDGAETIRICYNNEDETWNGNLYQAFPFTIGETSEDSTGSEPNIDLKVSNVSQALVSIVESYNGGNGSTVILRVVNTKVMGTTPELEERYSVISCAVDQDYVTFTLGSGYSLKTRRPLYRYMKNNCPFIYKGLRCACTSSLTTCEHTLTACRTRGNSSRFGGFVGIDQKGVYLNG